MRICVFFIIINNTLIKPAQMTRRRKIIELIIKRDRQFFFTLIFIVNTCPAVQILVVLYLFAFKIRKSSTTFSQRTSIYGYSRFIITKKISFPATKNQKFIS